MAKGRYLFLLVLLFVLALVPGLLSSPAEAQILGTNWFGTFYNNLTLTEPAVASNIPYPGGLSFNWGEGPPRQADGTTPVPGVNADNFSARFVSTQFFQPGTYRFTVQVNDGARVFFNGELVLDQFGNRTPIGTTASFFQFTRALNGNVNIIVEYVDAGGIAALQFQWGLSTDQVIPTSTPTPIATVSVVRVRGLAVRTGPYLGASLITVARPNNAYEVLARNNSEGLFVWYRIRVGDNTGWASGRYLQTAGNIDAIPFTGSIFDEIDNPDLPPALNVTGVTRAIMNFRVRPSERTQIIDKIPWGAEVQVIGRTIQGGRNFWLQVRWNGRVGWIFAPYVGLRGTVDALRTY